MLDNNLKVRAQQSDFLNVSNENSSQKAYIKVAEDYDSEHHVHGKLLGTASPKPITEQLQTEFDVNNSRDDKQLSNAINFSKFSQEVKKEEP
jgi:uncharacterized protein YueI